MIARVLFPSMIPKYSWACAAHMLWELHQQDQLDQFQAGEMIAFRKIFERHPLPYTVDEASIEAGVA